MGRANSTQNAPVWILNRRQITPLTTVLDRGKFPVCTSYFHQSRKLQSWHNYFGKFWTTRHYSSTLGITTRHYTSLLGITARHSAPRLITRYRLVSSRNTAHYLTAELTTWQDSSLLGHTARYLATHLNTLQKHLATWQHSSLLDNAIRNLTAQLTTLQRNTLLGNIPHGNTTRSGTCQACPTCVPCSVVSSCLIATSRSGTC